MPINQVNRARLLSLRAGNALKVGDLRAMVDIWRQSHNGWTTVFSCRWFKAKKKPKAKASKAQPAQVVEALLTLPDLWLL